MNDLDSWESKFAEKLRTCSKISCPFDDRLIPDKPLRGMSTNGAQTKNRSTSVYLWNLPTAST
jgi:hypothetical protein